MRVLLLRSTRGDRASSAFLSRSRSSFNSRNTHKAGVRPSGVSEMEAFKSIFADLELLRMPMTKFEIAKDDKIKEPLPLQRKPANNDASDQTIYDSKDPARYHLMPTGMSPRGSIRWVAL